MFYNRLKFHRLKQTMSQEELAARSHLPVQTISRYEQGVEMPSMAVLKTLAQVLNVRVSDFLMPRHPNLTFQHGEFNAMTVLSRIQQEWIRESTEEYFSRFFSVVDLFEENVLPPAPAYHTLQLTQNSQQDAHNMRLYLGLAAKDPMDNLLSVVENTGILLYCCDVDGCEFAGVSGLVNGRPYIVVNANTRPEQRDFAVCCQLARLLFAWSDECSEEEKNRIAAAISRAFLRCEKAVKIEWESPLLLERLVLRAVQEQKISLQKGAELLQMPYGNVVNQIKK